MAIIEFKPNSQSGSINSIRQWKEKIQDKNERQACGTSCGNIYFLQAYEHKKYGTFPDNICLNVCAEQLQQEAKGLFYIL